MFESFERFTSEQNRHNHYIKHIVRGKELLDITEEEYELLANQLQTTPVNYKNVLGYISDYNGRESYCKYDKDTGLFVVYYYKDNTPLTVTAYIKSPRKYEADKAVEYIDEIPKGK